MIFGERNFQLSTTVFHYGLTPYEEHFPLLYSGSAGTRNAYQARIRTMTNTCGCSEYSARQALHELQAKGFIDIKGNAQMLKHGSHRQTCNRYYLLDRSEWQPPQ